MIRRAIFSAALAVFATFAFAQELRINDGGTWREATEVHVNDSGTWRNIQEVHVNDGGTWRLVFQAAVFFVPTGFATDNQLVPNPATAQVVFATDGTGTATNQAGFNWVTPTSLAPGAYTIRAHVAAGSTPSGSTLDADLALSSQRSWLVTQSGAGTTSSTLDLTLKDGGGNTVASDQLVLEAIVDP